MVYSMTGYGRCKKSDSGFEVTVEIKSVNHRFFEYSSRISRAYQFLDEKVNGLTEILQKSVSQITFFKKKSVSVLTFLLFLQPIIVTRSWKHYSKNIGF